MADTGWKNPASVATVKNGFASVDWTNPTNVYASDDADATAFLSKFTRPSYFIDVTNFTMGVPAGATIDGIVVSIEKAETGGDDTIDETVQLIKGGTAQGDNKADIVTVWPVSDTYIPYGNATAMWGLAFSAADINASNFGVRIATNWTMVNNTTTTGYIDHVRIKVYYTEGGEAFFESLDDSLGVTDSLAKVATYKRAPDDTLSLSDARKLSFKPKLAHTLNISDDIATIAAYKRTPADTLSLSDLMASAAAYKRAVAGGTLNISDLLEHLKKIILDDQVGITEGLVSIASYKRSPDDSFSISDALQHKKKLSLGDSFSVGDGLTKEARIPIDELLSIADALKKTFKTSFSDTLSISDILSIGVIEVELADTLTISDLLELKWKISIGEELSIADQVLVARVFYLTDTLSISDALTHQFIVPGGLSDLTQTPALIVTKCYAIADDVPKTEKLRVWARAKDGKEKVIYIDPA